MWHIRFNDITTIGRKCFWKRKTEGNYHMTWKPTVSIKGIERVTARLERAPSARMRRLAPVSHDVTRRALSETRKWVARRCLCWSVDSRIWFPPISAASRSTGGNGSVYFGPVEKVVRGGSRQAAVEVCHRDLPVWRGAGGVPARRGGVEQAPQERAGKAVGQARELAGGPAQVRHTSVETERTDSTVRPL